MGWAAIVTGLLIMSVLTIMHQLATSKCSLPFSSFENPASPYGKSFSFSFNNPGAIWHFEEVFTETFRWGLHTVAVYSFTQHVKVHWFNSSWKHKFPLGLVSRPRPNKTEFPTCNEPLLARGWKCFVQLNPIYSSM